MKYTTNKLHPSKIGKFFELRFGLEAWTRDFNQYRKMFGMQPVKTHTVHRYNGGKSGYETSVPTVYKNFIISRIA